MVSPRRVKDKVINKIKTTGEHIAGTPNELNNSKYRNGESDSKKSGKRWGVNLKLRLTPRRKNKRKKRSTEMEDIIKLIVLNRNGNINKILSECENHKKLSEVARKLLTIYTNKWLKSGEYLVSEDISIKLPINDWKIDKDGSVTHKGFNAKLDSDWLYDLYQKSSGYISEETNLEDEDDLEDSEIDSEIDASLDPDEFADMLTNAATIVRKLSDKEVQKYVISASKNNVDNIDKLKESLKEHGVNWKFSGGEISGGVIYLNVDVKYSIDGTQSGVEEKTLSIEVKPNNDVIEKNPDLEF